MADEYSKEFSKVRQKYSLKDGLNDGKCRRNKPNRMSDAEIMVILILSPVLSSYSRFVVGLIRLRQAQAGRMFLKRRCLSLPSGAFRTAVRVTIRHPLVCQPFDSQAYSSDTGAQWSVYSGHAATGIFDSR